MVRANPTLTKHHLKVVYRFKIFEDGWTAANKGAGDNDLWGVKDMNTCCGKVDVKIPSDLAAGDYLLRAEVVALHTAQSTNGAQFYMSCCTPTPLPLS